MGLCIYDWRDCLLFLLNIKKILSKIFVVSQNYIKLLNKIGILIMVVIIWNFGISSDSNISKYFKNVVSKHNFKYDNSIDNNNFIISNNNDKKPIYSPSTYCSTY